MELRDLTGVLETPMLMGTDNVDIANIQPDSCRVMKGSLFVAVRGTAVDGHICIDSTIGKEAVVIVCGGAPSYSEGGCSSIAVRDSTEALGLLVSRWYGDPPGKLVLIGVTGTNGKTMIATLLYEALRKMGHEMGLLSAVCNYTDDEAAPTDHMTLDSPTLHSLMTRMMETGCEYAFMKVSSHSIDQRRIGGSSFDGGIFANLIRDYLGYHKTIESYLKAKKKFFDDSPVGVFALMNADDKSGLMMLQDTRAKKLIYSLRTLADFKGKILESHFEGADLIINGRKVVVHFMGRPNAYNLLVMHRTVVSLGKDPEEMLVVPSMLRSVPGRFETIQSPPGYTAIVDYAHTPDASTNVLNGIRGALDGRGRIITVVGTGRNRDKGRYPLMAKKAVKLSDQVVLTSDNLRLEEPDDIISDMVTGLTRTDIERALCITNCMQAIGAAMMLAKKGDVILVVGKGHEDYQGIEGVKHHFNDREKLREISSTQ